MEEIYKREQSGRGSSFWTPMKDFHAWSAYTANLHYLDFLCNTFYVFNSK